MVNASGSEIHSQMLIRRRRRRHIPHSQRPAEFVRERNARERKRVNDVNNAFTALRGHLPKEMELHKLSKVHIIRGAMEYITYLTRCLLKSSLSSRRYILRCPSISKEGQSGVKPIEGQTSHQQCNMNEAWRFSPLDDTTTGTFGPDDASQFQIRRSDASTSASFGIDDTTMFEHHNAMQSSMLSVHQADNEIYFQHTSTSGSRYEQIPALQNLSWTTDFKLNNQYLNDNLLTNSQLQETNRLWDLWQPSLVKDLGHQI